VTVKPPNPPFIAARHHGGSQVPKAIVLHGTVSPDNPGTARNIANWWHGPTSPETSAHYLRDPKETIQCVGDHTVAYHCGYNTGSIGYEFCDEQVGPATRWQDSDSQAILKGAAKDIARLCLAYDIAAFRPSISDLKAKGPHGIYGHNDSRLAFGNTTHSDPRDFPWEQFLRMVRTEMRILTADNEKPESMEITVGTMNVTPRASEADLRRFMNACDFGVLQETGKVMSRVNDAADATGRRLIVTDNAGAKSTPAFWNPKVGRLIKEIWLPAIEGGSGPDIHKDKGWQGGRFELTETDPDRYIDILGGHLPFNQDDSAAQRREADKMAKVLRDYGARREFVATVGLADWNEEAKHVPYLAEAGWRCNQIALNEIATHGAHWAPDQGWIRSTDRTRLAFVSHRDIKTGSDHDALVITLRVTPRIPA
jgi:hypothetical protein